MTEREPGRLVRTGGVARLATLLVAGWKLPRHPRTPRAPKAFALFMLAYARCPSDLIPDFIPVLGLLDEIVLLPLGIALVIKLVPRELWQECLREAERSSEKLPQLRWGIVIVLAVWLLVLGLLLAWLLPRWLST
jgi:uncharacterized membrane protein YkvA (DUF1232 family)